MSGISALGRGAPEARILSLLGEDLARRQPSAAQKKVLSAAPPSDCSLQRCEK